MTVNGIYSYNKKWLLIDITIDSVPDEIDWFGFLVPIEGKEEFDCPAPYMEQYLSPDGKEKLCDTWNEPEKQTSPTRTVFFIRKTSGTVLETPYGNIDISSPEKLPQSYSELIEFEEE